MDTSLKRESVPYAMKLSKSKSEESLENIFQTHWSSIHRFISRMVIDPVEAEDLALETFYRLYKHRPDKKDDSNTRGWLFKVATNLALQSIRSFKRREKYEINAGKDALIDIPVSQPAIIFAKKEEHHLVRIALGQMKPRQAELLIMRHSGMSYKEIAHTLHLSPASIGPLLLRAEREFEKQYRALTREDENE
jgi:RNA polymerase sigma factor (sigma-70 family)